MVMVRERIEEMRVYVGALREKKKREEKRTYVDRGLGSVQGERAKGILLEMTGGIGLGDVLPPTAVDFLAADHCEGGGRLEERGGGQIGADTQRFADENVLGRSCCCCCCRYGSRIRRLLGVDLHWIGRHESR